MKKIKVALLLLIVFLSLGKIHAKTSGQDRFSRGILYKFTKGMVGGIAPSGFSSITDTIGATHKERDRNSAGAIGYGVGLGLNITTYIYATHCLSKEHPMLASLITSQGIVDMWTKCKSIESLD